MLTYMDEDLILQVKTAALVHDMNVYELLEEAARLWLARRQRDADRRARRVNAIEDVADQASEKGGA